MYPFLVFTFRLLRNVNILYLTDAHLSTTENTKIKRFQRMFLYIAHKNIICDHFAIAIQASSTPDAMGIHISFP